MKTLIIKRARIEYGFHEEADQPAKTQTHLKDIQITDGVVTKIEEDIAISDGAEVIDANGALLAPSFREMHIHIDKTYFGGPWKACKPITNGIVTRIEEEEQLLPAQLKYAPERAEIVIQHLMKHGHTHIRSHCNIDPSIGLKNLEVTVQALEAYKDHITYDIVAFPQHGLLRSEVEPLMRDAMKKGATIVGGVDPATIDRNIEESLQTTFSIAQETNAGVDLHLHDPDTLGAFTFHRLAELTMSYGLEGRVTISHANALGDLHGEVLEEMLQTIHKAGIDITSTIPINRPTIPVPTLDKTGIQVSVGHDSLTDHWDPFGSGNTIEKLSVLAERFNVADERGLHDIWKYASGGITSIDQTGAHAWPNVGDKANMLLLDATCTAEAIARRKNVKHTISNGTIIY